MNVADSIIDLEVKLAFQEKWIAELDDVVRALRDEIDELRSEVTRLGDQVNATGTETPHEKPPHY